MNDTAYPKRPLRKRLLSLAGFSLMFIGLILLPIYVAYVAKHDSYVPKRTNKQISGLISSGTPSPKASAEFSYHIPVLTYHYIRTVEDPQADPLGFRLSVTPTDFDVQMKYLVDKGYTTVLPEEVSTALKNKKPLPAKRTVTQHLPIPQSLGFKHNPENRRWQ